MADPQTSDPELESSSSDEEIDLDNVEITENPIALSSTQKDSVPEYPASPQATPPTSPVTAVEPAELTRTPSKLSDPPPIKRKVGRPRGANYKPRSKPTEKIISETDDTIVVLKSRHKPVQKKRIVVYKEDLFGDFDTPIEVVAKSRKKGRPPSLPKIVEEVNEEPEVVIERQKAPAPPTAAELKKLELEAKLIDAQRRGEPTRPLSKEGKIGTRTDKRASTEAHGQGSKD